MLPSNGVGKRGCQGLKTNPHLISLKIIKIPKFVHFLANILQKNCFLIPSFFFSKFLTHPPEIYFCLRPCSLLDSQNIPSTHKHDSHTGNYTRVLLALSHRLLYNGMIYRRRKLIEKFCQRASWHPSQETSLRATRQWIISSEPFVISTAIQ